MTQLDQYTIVQTIYQGSSNTVMLGKHRTSGENVAIKAVKFHNYEDQGR